jgi:hypothetical protein
VENAGKHGESFTENMEMQLERNMGEMEKTDTILVGQFFLANFLTSGTKA